MPWLHRGHIKTLQEDVRHLKREISRLLSLMVEAKIEVPKLYNN